MMPMLFSTMLRQRSLFAVMPLTQRSCNVRMAWRRRWMPFDSEKAMIGSMTFNSSCPASAAIVMVTSLPMMSKATCETTSGMTGLTLPGMIEEPGCNRGRLISLMPVRGPEDSRRRSLQILDSLTAMRLSTPEVCT